MRRLVLVVAAIAALLMSFALPAAAESATVNGTGDITKMYVNNGRSAVTVEVYGLSRPCGAASVIIDVSWRRKGLYRAEGVCIQSEWYTGLWYSSTGAPEEAVKVRCPRFALTYERPGRFYRMFAPRACLDNAGGKIRASTFGNNFGSTTGGEAGPTRLLNQG